MKRKYRGSVGLEGDKSLPTVLYRTLFPEDVKGLNQILSLDTGSTPVSSINACEYDSQAFFFQEINQAADKSRLILLSTEIKDDVKHFALEMCP